MAVAAATVREKQLLFLMSNEHVSALYHFWLLLIAEKSRAGRLRSPFSLYSVWTEILLRREQGWGKINDMSYICLFRYVFTKPFVCVWVCVCASKCGAMFVSWYPPSTDTHQHVFLITILHSSLSPQMAARASVLATVRYPMKPQRAAHDDASHVQPYVYSSAGGSYTVKRW